jgi:ankyrin repeat protein
MFSDLMSQAIVRFVDIGEIVDHHRLNFLFIFVCMHIAACSGRDDLFDVIEFLLDSGSEVDAQTKADEDTINMSYIPCFL